MLAPLRLSLDGGVDEARKDNFRSILGRCDPRLVDYDALIVTHNGPAGFDTDSLSEASHSEYASQQTIGGHAPFKTFLRNSNRMLQFSLDFRADGFRAEADARMRQVRWPVALLDSLCYPFVVPGTSRVLPPPLVIVGVSDFVHVRGFVRSLGVSWGTGWGPGTLDGGNWLPDSAMVVVSLIGVGFGGGGYDGSSYSSFHSARR